MFHKVKLSTLVIVGITVIAVSSTAARGGDADEAMGAADSNFVSVVIPFLESHCVSCHAQPRPKGKLDLSGMSPASMRDEPKLWQQLIAMIDAGDMPPRTEIPPEEEEVTRVANFLSATLAEQLGLTAQEPVPIKRLTRIEYRNAIRDLFGVDYAVDQRFPADEVGHGFDNIADLLSLSPLLVEKYLDAAEFVAQQAVYDRATDTPPFKRFEAKDFEQRGPGHYLNRGVQLMSTNGEAFVRYEVKTPGRYRVRSHLFGQQAGAELVKMAFQLDGVRKEIVEVAQLRDDPGQYSVDLVLEQGTHRIGVAFINDYWDPKNKDPKQRDRNAGVVDIEVSGPLDAPTLPRYQEQRLPQPLPVIEWRSALQPIVEELMWRAYRRPVTSSEVSALLDHVGEMAAQEDSVESRWRGAIATILMSPNFLYRSERAAPPGGVRSLDSFEVASRLSFFLWSSIPDEELLEQAAAQRLLTASALREQVARMLKDARSRALASNFAEQWLQLRSLGESPPDPQRFPLATAQLLSDMRQETLSLVECVLREERSVWTLLDADFTFVNAALAKHYGLPEEQGVHLRRVPLADGARGGLLRHASILTLASTPTRPSPVLRGKWILEVLLDAAPPPPPPDITSLVDSQTRDAHSLREQLELHRADPQCAGCHARMDALGFGLQNFDAVGRFRRRQGGEPIDASGRLPDGTTFSGPDGLRDILLGDRGYLRSLAKNLLLYALGRGLNLADRPLLERLVAGLEEEPTFKRLITDIVLSDALRKRASE